MAKKNQPMSIIDHLTEMRRRLIFVGITVLVASITCFIYAGPLLDILTRGIELIYIRPPEAMLAHLRVAFTAGVMISSPVIFYQVIAFLAPALNKKEKRVLFSAVILMFILFFTGICFAWFIVFPFALTFFASFASEQLSQVYTISEYVSFASGFMLGFGLVFQLPLSFWVLGALGIISSRFLRGSRKYALILILIVSAIITPPDIVSQVLMTIPMLGLYEMGIMLVVMTERGRRKKAALAAEND